MTRIKPCDEKGCIWFCFLSPSVLMVLCCKETLCKLSTQRPTCRTPAFPIQLSYAFLCISLIFIVDKAITLTCIQVKNNNTNDNLCSVDSSVFNWLSYKVYFKIIKILPVKTVDHETMAYETHEIEKKWKNINCLNAYCMFEFHCMPYQ